MQPTSPLNQNEIEIFIKNYKLYEFEDKNSANTNKNLNLSIDSKEIYEQKKEINTNGDKIDIDPNEIIDIEKNSSEDKNTNDNDIINKEINYNDKKLKINLVDQDKFEINNNEFEDYTNQINNLGIISNEKISIANNKIIYVTINKKKYNFRKK
jgi:hypothetical protein